MLDFRGLIEKAIAALEGERPAEAEKHIRAALAMSPRDDQLLHLLGVALIRQQREEEAIEPLRKAISLNRRDAEYHNALGCALRNTGQVAEGIESLQRALKLEPGLQDARFNLAQAYQREVEFGKAEEEFKRILSQNPNDVETIHALASHYWFLDEFDRAIATYREGIRRVPQSGDLRFTLGERLMALGQFEEGWWLYLWRVNRNAFLQKFRLPFDSPALLAPYAASLQGQTVKVHAEQGIGDDLFFLRFVHHLRERGARVEGAVTPRLLGMIGRSGVLDALGPAPERIPPTPDYRLLADLPYLLQAHALPPPPPIRFDPLPGEMEKVRARLAAAPRPLVGLTWRAGTGPEAASRNTLFKEVPFRYFVDFAREMRGTPVILQRAPKSGEVERLGAETGGRALDLSMLNAELETMLALLAQIDEYVGVSNTNTHLCAALGRSQRVLVSRGNEFRWMASGTGSPWFPGFPVYRQGARGDWQDAFSAVKSDLTS